MPIFDFGLRPVRAYAPEGLRPGEVGHSEIDKTLHVVNFATVECPSPQLNMLRVQQGRRSTPV
jgi:hypothetical protein